jgi:hypothetical protein
MVAVPEMCVSAPVAKTDTGRSSVPVHSRRVVAVAVSAMELLRPESDLVRLIEGFPHVDLLVAGEDLPATAPGPVGVLGYTEYADYDDDQDGAGASGDPDVDEVRDGVARLGLPGLHLHRLGLRLPLHPGAEGDLVAALSELVGFDPEPGVQVLAPVSPPGDAHSVIERAVLQIVQVYSLPLQRYRCLELSIVEPE